MTCLRINDGFLCLSKIKFSCPNCKCDYSDNDDKYLNRCNKNKKYYTKIKCKCGQTFYMTYNYKGDATSFIF